MFKKMIMFASSLASRGLGNNKTDIATKQLRVLSCFGGSSITTPCVFLKTSSGDPTKNYCGGCGCGDKPHTWLIQKSDEYSKLDYPILNCPMKMPGFSNYDPNFYPIEIKLRKEAIESLDPTDIHLIQVTIGYSEEKEKLIDKINKIVENS
tara:strand:+ start:746 stop:1198 length:453 start_codon:yes stop_codon:yes gene_type:complete